MSKSIIAALVFETILSTDASEILETECLQTTEVNTPQKGRKAADLPQSEQEATSITEDAGYQATGTLYQRHPCGRATMRKHPQASMPAFQVVSSEHPSLRDDPIPTDNLDAALIALEDSLEKLGYPRDYLSQEGPSVCRKCGGTGEFTFTFGHRAGEVAPCAACYGNATQTQRDRIRDAAVRVPPALMKAAGF